MPRVMLVVGANQIGGAERQVQQLARALVDAGHDATIVFLERPGRRPAAESLPLGSIRHSYLHRTPWTSFFARWKFSRLLRRERPDLLHLYNLEAIEFGARVARQAGTGCIVGNVRGLLFTRDRSVRERLQLASRNCDALTGNCEAITRGLAEFDVGRESSRHTLPNIILPPASNGSGPGDSTTVLFVGTLKEVKDPRLFVEAALAIRSRAPGTTFLLAGDGPLRAELEATVAAAGASEQFSFLGRIDASEIPYASASVTVSSSRSEGASNTLLEALAHGCPVVATAVGGSVEIVENSRAGRLVPAGNAEAIAESVLELLGSAELRRTMGTAGRRYVEDVHAPARVVQRHMDLLQELSGPRAGAAQ